MTYTTLGKIWAGISAIVGIAAILTFVGLIGLAPKSALELRLQSWFIVINVGQFALSFGLACASAAVIARRSIVYFPLRLISYAFVLGIAITYVIWVIMLARSTTRLGSIEILMGLLASGSAAISGGLFVWVAIAMKRLAKEGEQPERPVRE